MGWFKRLIKSRRTSPSPAPPRRDWEGYLFTDLTEDFATGRLVTVTSGLHNYDAIQALIDKQGWPPGHESCYCWLLLNPAGWRAYPLALQRYILRKEAPAHPTPDPF